MANSTNHIEAIYGEDNIYSPRAIQEYLNRLRRADRAACVEIADTAELLQAVIEASPGIGILLGYDSKRKARIICEPLHEAANAHNAAAALATLAWQRFNKSFGPAIEQARRAKRGGGRRSMDWTDA